MAKAKKTTKKKAAKRKPAKKKAAKKRTSKKKTAKRKPAKKKAAKKTDGVWTSPQGMTFLELGDTVWMHVPEDPETSVYRYIVYRDEETKKWGAAIWDLAGQAPVAVGVEPTKSGPQAAAKALEKIVPSFTRAPTVFAEDGKAIVAANPKRTTLKKKLMR